MLVVSDTSPLRALHHLGLVHVIPSLYSESFIPPAVAAELNAGSPSFPAINVGQFPFLQIKAPNQVDPALLGRWELDRGESEAISLAVELGADTLLVDELKARRVASSIGIQIVGVLGLLIDAKRRSMITAVRPLADRLRRDQVPHLGRVVRPRMQTCEGVNACPAYGRLTLR